MRVSLTRAARLTGRSEHTIGMWIARRELSADEAIWGERGPRLGRGWQIDVTALQRVHRAHGGTRWYAEVFGAEPPSEHGAPGTRGVTGPSPVERSPQLALPPDLTKRLHQLEAELAWLQRVVRGMSGREASTAVAPAPAAAAPFGP